MKKDDLYYLLNMLSFAHKIRIEQLEKILPNH